MSILLSVVLLFADIISCSVYYYLFINIFILLFISIYVIISHTKDKSLQTVLHVYRGTFFGV